MLKEAQRGGARQNKRKYCRTQWLRRNSLLIELMLYMLTNMIIVHMIQMLTRDTDAYA